MGQPALALLPPFQRRPAPRRDADWDVEMTLVNGESASTLSSVTVAVASISFGGHSAWPTEPKRHREAARMSPAINSSGLFPTPLSKARRKRVLCA